MLTLPALLLAALLPLASAACAQADPARTAGPGGATRTATVSNRQRQQAPSPSSDADGRWHHFGEQPSSTAPRPRPSPSARRAAAEPSFTSGGWHRFGPASPPKASGPASPTRASGNSARNGLPRYAPRPSAEKAAAAVPAPHASAPARRAAKTAPHRAGSGGQYEAGTTAELARQMLALINRDRREAGAAPLRWSAQLAAVALAHSQDMIRRHYFGHVDPQGRSVSERLSDAGIAWEAVGENIAIAPTTAQAETEFMDEPRHQQNHRWNILHAGYTEVGVGVARGPRGELYITQDFMKGLPGR